MPRFIGAFFQSAAAIEECPTNRGMADGKPASQQHYCASDTSTAFREPVDAYRMYARISANCSALIFAAAGGCFHTSFPGDDGIERRAECHAVRPFEDTTGEESGRAIRAAIAIAAGGSLPITVRSGPTAVPFPFNA